MGYEKTTLSNFQSGALEEKFQYALNEVIKNIEDPNCNIKEVRKINIEIKLLPSETGDKVAYSFNVTWKLAPIKKGAGYLILSKQQGSSKNNLFEEISVELPLFEKNENEIILTQEAK